MGLFGLIGRKFHVSYSVSGATRLMHRSASARQVPARRVAECDEVSPWTGPDSSESGP
ncbi:winged helix-turn-helix domain-containing protein [Streptomyces sp. NBC_01231]|nr:winged helix-turn-helix domain-containing protein [Streptomyces sp. NBC_01231]